MKSAPLAAPQWKAICWIVQDVRCLAATYIPVIFAVHVYETSQSKGASQKLDSMSLLQWNSSF